MSNDNGRNETAEHSAEFYQSLIENMLDTIIVVDKAGTIRYQNPSARRIFGYDPAEIIGRNTFELVHPEDLPQVRQAFQQISQESGRVQTVEARFQYQDGSYRVIEAIGRNLLDHPSVAGIVLNARDITERKQVEETLRESQQVLQTILDNIPYAVFWKNADLVYLGCNKNFVADTGLDTPAAVVGKTDFELRWINEAILYRTDDRQILTTGQPKLNYEEPQTTPDGRQIWVQTSKVPLRDATGQVVAVLGMYQDITVRKQAEAALHQSEATNRALLEAIPDAIFRLDRDGFYIDFIPAKDFQTLVPPNEFLGKNQADILPPELAQQFDLYIRRTLQTGEIQFYEYPLPSNGETRYYEARLVKVGSNEVLGIVRDITNRKQAEAERERFAMQLSTAAEIAGQVSAILNPDELLNAVISLLKERFGLYYVHLYTLNVETVELVLRAGYGEPGRMMLERGHTIPLNREQSLVARAARTQEVVHAPNVAEDRYFLPNPLLPETRSEVAVPLVVGKQVLGVFDIQHDKAHYFSQSYLDVFRTLAGQIAIALQNAIFVAQIEQSLAETDLRFEVSQALARAQTEPEVLDILSQQAGLYPKTSVSIHLIDHEAAELTFRLRRTATPDGLIGDQAENRFWESLFPLLASVPSNQSWVLSNLQLDGRVAPASRDFARQMGLVSLAIIPLISGIDWLGVMVVSSAQVEYFDERKLRLYQILADQGAAALQAARLKETLRLTQFSVDHLSDGAFWLDTEARFFYVNKSACRITGYTRDELLAMSVSDLTADNLGENWQDYWQETPGRPFRSFESLLKSKDGGVIPVEISTNHFNFEGKSYNCTFVRDITERKRQEEEREQLITQLETKNAELERFTYTVSHDLKSPLITIKGFLGWLEKDAATGDAERMQRDIQHIREAADKMHDLLDDLLELSRIGRLMNAPQTIPLAELVQEAVKLVGGRIAARGVQVDITPDLPTVYGDWPRLVEVLQNLLDNAVKFMGDQPVPRVEIGAYKEVDETIIYVRDNGRGIEPRYQHKIFGLFERLDQSVEGTGIGLALVKRIVEVHGGRIWVESQLGQGATFYFSLGNLPEPKQDTGRIT